MIRRLSSTASRRGAALALLVAGSLAAGRAGAAPSRADQAVATAGRRLEDGRPGAYVELAAAFMQKARESGDPGYYGRARTAVERALAADPDDYDARRTLAWVLLGLHDFRGARALADAARARQPDDWWNYALLTDAYVELGEYERATDAAQRMIDLRPGMPAYARIGFLRTLFGDRCGAIAMLERAVAAGSAHDPESLAWTLVHLGHEHLATGALARAATIYEQALAVLPDYYLALAGLGRVRAAEGRLDEAAELYRRAVAQIPAPDLVAALGDVYAAAGRAHDAEEQYAVVAYMGRVAAATGTTYGRQLALFYADHDREPAEALRLARGEAATRGDIYTDDALAWALLKNGHPVEAMRAAHRALRLGTEDAMLYYHTGMIAAAHGRARRAARDLGRALAINPYFDLRQAPIARTTLAGVESTTRLAARAAR